ncbi:unnamed protein product, partial [Prorocentrum cordatum]
MGGGGGTRKECGRGSRHPAPGSCGPSCLCMDGTRKHDEWERRKSWIEEDESRGRDARKCLDAFSKERSVLARGRVSGQHFLEPAAGAAAARGPGPAEEPLAPCE